MSEEARETNMVEMVYVPVRANPTRVRVDTTETKEMYRLIGGWLEAIGGDDWTCYMDEEGKIKNLPVNTLASAVATILGWQGVHHGDLLCGPVLFCGPTDGDGYDSDVTERITKLIFEPFGEEEGA